MFTIVAFSLAGCQSNAGQQTQDNNIVDIHYTDKKKPNDIAEHLVNIASSVPDVNDATALVIGQYAIVGIDVNKDLDRSRVGTVKYTVGEALKDDPYGANAIITADTDITERMKNMQENMQAGRPVAGVMEELAEIVNRIMPETPGQLFEEKQVHPERKNDQQLNKNEEQQLRKEQEKQDLDR